MEAASVLHIPEPARSLRSMLTEFVREATDGEDEVRTQDLIDLACKRFQGDAEFAEAAARDLIPALLPAIVERLFHHRKKDMVATIGYFEYVDRPVIGITVRVLDDCVSEEQWARIWTVAEHNGMGARRSQGAGQFVVTAWDRVEA